jgi:hypothetical protein
MKTLFILSKKLWQAWLQILDRPAKEIPALKQLFYKSCEVCNCGDCKNGNYRLYSWFCPVLRKQICDVCCYYDIDDYDGESIRMKCKSLKCEYYVEHTNNG